MTYYVPDDDCVRTIPFGRVGENDYTTIAFDISSWQQNYTIDTVVLLIQRHGDTEAYPVLVDIQDNYAVHTLNTTDMAKLGNGKCQLRMRSGDVIGKSRVYNTICLVSLDPGEDPPPAPVPGWLDHMEDLVAEAEGYAEDASQAATEAVEEKFADLTVEAEGLSPGSAPTVSYDDETNKITFGIPNASDVPTKTSDITNDGEDGTSRYVEEDEIANGKLVLRLLTGNACELNKFSSPYKTGCTADYFHDLLDNRMNLLICGFPTDSTTKGYRYTIVEDKTTTHPGIPVSTHDYKLVLAAVVDSSPTPFMRVAILTANDTDPYTGTYADYPLYTDTEKTKLSGIAAGAQVNTIDTIKVNGTALTPDANKAVDISVPSPSPVVLSIIDDMNGTYADFSYPDFKAAITSGNPVIFLYYDETIDPVNYYVYTLTAYYDGYLNNRPNTIELSAVFNNKVFSKWKLTSPTGSTANMTPVVTNATLATVATSGSYNDLSNKPTIPAAQVNSDWNAISGVAQILNKPTIPTLTSQLNNDSGFITLADLPIWNGGVV